MIYPRALRLVLVLLAVTSLGLGTLPAHALTLSPARYEINGDPGTTVSGVFTLINDQGDTQTFYSSVQNFEANGESGAPNFVVGTDGLVSWLHVAPQITLRKGEEQKVPFEIRIPAGTEPGGYFAAIFLSTNAPEANGGQVTVGAKVGMLVLLRVNGVIKEGGGVTSFMPAAGGRLLTSLPIKFTYRFQNSGSDRVKPDGDLVIKDTVGLTAATLPANPHQGNVLPRSTRKFDITWGNETEAAPSGFFSAAAYEWRHFALGFYTAHLALAYGSNTAEASYRFLVIPWQLIIIFFVVLCIIVFILSRLLRAYNRWIIAKARSN